MTDNFQRKVENSQKSSPHENPCFVGDIVDEEVLTYIQVLLLDTTRS